MSTAPIQRLLWLDALRGVAIALVILFHLTAHYGVKYPHQPSLGAPPLVLNWGWVGVYLFFLISGYIIYLTIQTKPGVGHFLLARLTRLLPPFWVSIAALLLIELAHQQVFGVSHHRSWYTIFANASMFPDELRAAELQGAYWSLFVELKFYFLFALLWRLADMKRQAVFMASFAVLLALWAAHEYIHNLPLGSNFKYFIPFWLGIAAYKLRHEDLSRGYYLGITVATALALGFGINPVMFAAIPVFALLMAIGPDLARASWLAMGLRPLAALGRISYSVYLLHEPLGYLVLGALALYGWHYGAALLFAVAAILLAAYPSYRYIERSDKRIANYVLAKFTARAPKPAAVDGEVRATR